jgi:hypothetical protein
MSAGILIVSADSILFLSREITNISLSSLLIIDMFRNMHGSYIIY